MTHRLALVLSAACLLGGCGTTQKIKNDFGDFAGRIWDMATNNTASSQAKKMEDPYFPDERREGIAKLSNRNFGRGEPYTQRYQQIAQTDDDYLVRAAAIRALNRARDQSATPIFVNALSAKEPQVRLEAAKALANVPDAAAVGPLLRLTGDANENKDVRIAAADALRHYRRNEVARALVALLNDRDFGVSWQARQSLRALTGRDLQYDEAAWLALLSGNENPLG
jgi:HEAT repeat protein